MPEKIKDKVKRFLSFFKSYPANLILFLNLVLGNLTLILVFQIAEAENLYLGFALALFLCFNFFAVFFIHRSLSKIDMKDSRLWVAFKGLICTLQIFICASFLSVFISFIPVGLSSGTTGFIDTILNSLALGVFGILIAIGKGFYFTLAFCLGNMGLFCLFYDQNKKREGQSLREV